MKKPSKLIAKIWKKIIDSCFLFHDWGRWKTYENRVKDYHIWERPRDVEWSAEVRQKRTCKRCGKEEDELVR